MRFKSKQCGGFRVFAVSGINTVSFGIEATAEARDGLLGFAVERVDPKESQRYYMSGFKLFQSVVPHPTPHMRISTHDHPVQSFLWDDFTAKPDRSYQYRFYPLKGTPKNLDRTARPVCIVIHTEPLYSSQTHDVFFNRGVASSQAYANKFGNRKPDELPAREQAEALQWLSRNLDEALQAFIKQTRRGDALLCCFYEFRYVPVAEVLKEAIERGVDVQIIVDAKVNEHTDSNGKFIDSFPREENLRTIKAVRLPKKRIILRENNPNDIQHNKFMVLLKGQSRTPAEVWTGSTNISLGGIHGQTNVGHWVRDAEVAGQFHKYWELLSKDPGANVDDDRAAARKARAALRGDVAKLGDVPATVEDIPRGVTAVFSPRRGLDVLNLYVQLVDSAHRFAAITLAFGINRLFKEALLDNDAFDHLVFMLLEKEDRPNPRSKIPFVVVNASHNVYKAWGAYIDDPVYAWVREETNARRLLLNTHVSYMHSKFLLRDPLSADPIVVTGSANFSEASTNANDENMLLIRGDLRAADIYFSEFNRLFNHYYYRAVQQSTRKFDSQSAGPGLFLCETDAWLQKYKPGTLRHKRLRIYTEMEGMEDG